MKDLRLRELTTEEMIDINGGKLQGDGEAVLLALAILAINYLIYALFH